MPRQTKNFRIEEEVWARFARVSVSKDTTPSRLLRRLVLDFLEREGIEVNPPKYALRESAPEVMQPPTFRPIPKKR